jgi:hypothetical protein
MGKRLQPTSFVGRLLTDLLGRPTTVKDLRGGRPPEVGAAGIYRFVDGRLAGVAVADLAGAARSSAAMSLIPPGAAHDADEAQRLPPNLAENLVELFNVYSRFFCSLEAPRVRHVQTVLLPGALPDDVRGALLAPVEQLHLLVDVEGYGAGRLMLVAG